MVRRLALVAPACLQRRLDQAFFEFGDNRIEVDRLPVWRLCWRGARLRNSWLYGGGRNRGGGGRGEQVPGRPPWRVERVQQVGGDADRAYGRASGLCGHRTEGGALGGVALAVLAAFALLPVLGPAPVIPTVTATLRGEGQPLIVSARYDATSQRLSVRRNEGPGAGQGNDYQLWLIPAGQTPVPLGLIREADLTIELASLPAGTTLAVSLEPAGGSPTGQPTGPVLISTVIPEA